MENLTKDQLLDIMHDRSVSDETYYAAVAELEKRRAATMRDRHTDDDSPEV